MEVRPIDGNILRKWCEKIIDQACHPATVQIGEVILAKVRSMPTLTPPNEPLTCEELRKINEEPVWIQNLEKPEESQWRLLYWDKGKYLVLQGISVRGYLLEEYGESWFAYRRPPEGEADA